MKSLIQFSEEADDPGDQAEDAPKDTGEVEDTAQQEQATGDPDELPDLVFGRATHSATSTAVSSSRCPHSRKRQKRKRKRKVTRRLQRSIK